MDAYPNMVAICKWTQDWAIIRRYLIVMLRYPILSATRVILVPGLILGFCWYLLYHIDASTSKMGGLIWLHYLTVIALITTMFNVYSFANTLVTDKANGMKSLMLSMGLSRFHYYRATTLTFLTLILPVTIIMAIVVKVFLLSKVSYLTVIVFFILFSLQLDAFMTTLVSFIKSTNYTFIILLILFLENVIHDIAKLILRHTGTSWSEPVLFFISFSPYEAMRLFADSNITDIQSTIMFDDDRLKTLNQPMYLILLSQMFWTLFFKLFAYWFEEVCPWQTVSGVRHPCFCFGGKARSEQVDVDEFTDNSSISTKYFENIHKSQSDIGIRVNHVTKSYGNVPAVNDVSFAIYKGETTLLLGHNGAGKSTLMNMILGLTQPDNGAVKIVARSQLQTSIGVCPQTSVLDENLTVKQHLELFNDLKSNVSGSERTAHISQTIDDVSLNGQEEKLPPELSGGMKRKLSLAIAFIGKSQVLILDEPSSGLDPDSRVFVWNAIRRYRSDRTVLLSTQHMEEADYLGDRIAIMSSGRIVCCGSSVFLNEVFGVGYKLRLECRLSKKKHIMDHIRRSYFDGVQLTESSTDLPRDAKSDPIVDLVVELNKSNNNKLIDYELDLIRLLEDFENNSENLGIRSYGLKSSSIEDVMLNTSKYFAHEAQAATQLVMTSVAGHIAAITDKRVLHEPSCWTRLSALIMKHLQVNRANWFSALVLKLCLPIWGSYLVISKAKYNAVGVEQNFQSPTLGILFAHLIYYPVREKATKFKTVQLDTKARVWIYWLSQMCIDLTGAVICIIFINMFGYLFIEDQLLVPAREFHTLLSVASIIFYLSCMVFCYCLSNILTDPRTAIGYLFIILFLTTAGWLLTYIFRLAVLKMSGLQWFQHGLAYLGVLLSPADAYAFFLMGLKARCYLKSDISDSICQEREGPSPIIIGLAALCTQVVAYTVLLILIECQLVNIEWYFSWRNMFSCVIRKPKQRPIDTREIDRDVAEETTKALAAIDNQDNGHALVTARLNKSYIKHTKIIEDLAFTVNKGECFGLLGVNGAGKTTTFAMLSAETRPDSGQILANDRYYNQDLHRYRELFGYDPQATPSLSLTPYQALTLMARLRGVNEHSIPMMVGSILELLEMSQHTHKPDSKLSGGTKRKLALGMALIGNPAILALDEPTAGVDPLARRSVWQLLRSLRTRNDASIIVSSHAMEECEAICDRISIMARGKLRCIGTFLHLRSKFAKGFTLRIQFSNIHGLSRLSRSNERQQRSGNGSRESSQQRHSVVVFTAGSSTEAGQHSLANLKSTGTGRSRTKDSRRSSSTSLTASDPLVEEVQRQLNSAIGPSVFKLADRNVNSVTFNITDNRVRRSILFRMMRDFRQRHPNVSYMINDSSLEEIFISLAREQQEFEQQQREQPQQPNAVAITR